MPFCEALPEWKRLAIAPNCAAIKPAACEPARPSVLTYFSVSSFSNLPIAAAEPNVEVRPHGWKPVWNADGLTVLPIRVPSS